MAATASLKTCRRLIFPLSALHASAMVEPILSASALTAMLCLIYVLTFGNGSVAMKLVAADEVQAM